MSEPFLAEIKLVGFNFAPRGWAFCNGQVLPINQNQSLYSLLGTTYGGDGRSSFALPDLRGRTAMHKGAAVTLGQRAGTENETLTIAEIPNHSGKYMGSADQATSSSAADKILASKARRGITAYADPNNPAGLSGDTATGDGQGHNNMQPYLTVNFIIALQGLFPSRN